MIFFTPSLPNAQAIFKVFGFTFLTIVSLFLSTVILVITDQVNLRKQQAKKQVESNEIEPRTTFKTKKEKAVFVKLNAGLGLQCW